MGHDAPPRWDRRMQQRLAHGEAAALGELYDRFASLVHSLAHRVLDDEDAADRLTREVFTYIWEHPDSYDPKQGPLRSWIAGVTRHQAVQRLRQTEAASARDCGDGAPAPAEIEQKIREASTAARADYIVTSMPAPLRAALELAYFQRRDYRQTAADLGVTETRPAAGSGWACNCSPPPITTTPCRPATAPRTPPAAHAPPRGAHRATGAARSPRPFAVALPAHRPGILRTTRPWPWTVAVTGPDEWDGRELPGSPGERPRIPSPRSAAEDHGPLPDTPPVPVRDPAGDTAAPSRTPGLGPSRPRSSRSRTRIPPRRTGSSSHCSAPGRWRPAPPTRRPPSRRI